MRKILLFIMAAAMLLCGCRAGNESLPAAKEPEAETLSVFSDRDFDVSYDADGSAIIELKDSITIDKEGTYILSGQLADGMVTIDTDKNSKVQLVLDGVSIHSESSAAIYVKQADKVFITLAEGSENVLSNGGSFVAIDENNIDGVIFSKDDLSINGSGSLKIESPSDHGIVCKDSLSITGGNFEINAGAHAISCKEDIGIAAGVFVLTSGKDGIHAENSDDSTLAQIYIESGSFDITAEGDGISADSTLQIIDGSFNIVTGGSSAVSQQSSGFGGGFMGGGRGSGGRHGGMSGAYQQAAGTETESTSQKAFKAAGELTISGGSFKIDSADDAVHSNASITVNGGSFDIASGDDGFHADDTLTVNAGSISISESYEGLEALHLIIAGGDISLAASDDGLNAAGGTDQSGVGGRGGDRFGAHGTSVSSGGSIVISGGKLYIKAGGDGIDANGTLEITGGDIVVCTPTYGDTATMDYDVSAVIRGGSFIGTGAYGMAQSFSASEQGVIAVSVGSCAAGTDIKLADSSGKEILSYTPELDFAVVIISSEQIIKGESYTLYVGTLSGEIEAY